MSKKDSGNNNNSTDIGKGALDKSANAGKKGLNLARKSKNFIKVAKLLKSILTKVLGACLKWLAGLIGPYGILVIVLIILLMLVIDSVSNFDIFQKAGTRTDSEVIFDNAVQEVFQARLEDGPSEIRDELRNTQAESPWPAVSETWLYQTGEMLKLSISIPTIHHYFKNIENENYKPWHESYNSYSADNPENLLKQYMDIINDKLDYYFQGSPAYTPIYVRGNPPIEEYIKTTTTTTCSNTDDEGNTTTTTTGPTTTKTSLSHEIITEIQSGYVKAAIPHKESNTITHSTTSSGDCSSSIETETNLYIINDGMPPSVELLAEELVKILSVSSAEGDHTRLVQVQDLEYSIDLGQELDESFPKPDIDYDGLKKCYFKEKAIESCLGQFVLGGSLGDFGLSSGWYPAEYEAIYKAASDACGIDWWILAAVHGMETTFSSNPVATDPSKGSVNAEGVYVGALGHFQFMGATWVGWNAQKDYPISSVGAISGNIDFITVPENIRKYGGRGMDGNNDGVASPWDLTDAAYSSACYLKGIGYQKSNQTSIITALAKYNGGNNPGAAAQAYAKEVWDNGKQFEMGMEAGAPISVAPGDITYPTTGRISSPYGWRDLGYGKEFHYGVDIGSGGRTNVSIVSVADGVVTYSGAHASYGNYIRVKHNIDGFKFETLYAHLASRKVKEGATVTKGQKIGVMGNTGNSFGTHLHFETHIPNYIRQATNPVNPLTIIPTPPTN